MAGHSIQTLNYRIMQIVLEAAKGSGKDIFTATDVIYKVHESLPNMPPTTIRTYILAMSSSRDSVHPYFDLLGNESYRLINRFAEVPAPPSAQVSAPPIAESPQMPAPQTPPETIDEPQTSPQQPPIFVVPATPVSAAVLEIPKPKPPKPAEASVGPKTKEEFNQKYGATIIVWTKENRNALVIGRRNYRWKDKNLPESLDKRNELQKRLVLSRIRNVGGVDLATLDAIMAWGFPNPLFPERDEPKCLRVTREAFSLLDQGKPSEAIMKLMTMEHVGIGRASKIVGLYDQNYFAMLDSRVGSALKTLTYNGERLIKSPPGVNRVGDTDVTPLGWAENYQRLLWVLEIIRNELNEEGFPFSVADVEMALFIMGE
jgi:hypothetical protein